MKTKIRYPIIGFGLGFLGWDGGFGAVDGCQQISERVFIRISERHVQM
mgnify:CR=1 FL=1